MCVSIHNYINQLCNSLGYLRNILWDNNWMCVSFAADSPAIYIIARDSNVIMFSPCVFLCLLGFCVCVCVCVSVCVSVCLCLSVCLFVCLSIATSKRRPFWKFETVNTASFWPQIWNDRPKLWQKSIFMAMTSLMMSQGGPKGGPLYSFINEMRTFSW